MKNTLPEFYNPNEGELQTLWTKALFVFDTNVLLNLYRLPKDACNDFLTALESVRERSWIPFHVALEFQRNRPAVIASQHKVTNDALDKANECLKKTSDILAELQLEKRGLGLDPAGIQAALDEATAKLINAIQTAHTSQIPVGTSDEIRTRLDLIFDNSRVGEGPKSQSELDEIVKEGVIRFERRVPPGFEDANKAKNPNDATFNARGLNYERQYGDLFLWKQLISHVGAKKVESVIFVTSDNKNDWWLREAGKTLGPQPELAAELSRLAGAKQFWMYSMPQFLRFYKSQSGDEISQTSIDEVQSVADEALRSNPAHRTVDELDSHFSHGKAMLAVNNWLRRNMKGEISANDGFPDFWIFEGDKVVGVELSIFRRIRPYSFNVRRIKEHIERGMIRVRDVSARFVLIVVISEMEFFDLVARNEFTSVRKEFEELRIQANIGTVILGTLALDDFEPSFVIGEPLAFMRGEAGGS